MAKKMPSTIYDRFSQSLSNYRKAIGDSENTDNRTYVCPLCMKEYGIGDLTKEHTVPGKLGGKVKVLTCRKCNNDHGGAKLESKLVDFLKNKKYFSGELPFPSRMNEKLSNSEGDEIPITLGRNSKEEGTFNIHPDRIDPVQLQRFSDFLNSGGNLITLTYSYDVEHAMVALLRMAYLEVFSIFGYSLIFNKKFDRIRQQIEAPLAKIPPRIDSHTPWVLPQRYSNEWLGTSIVVIDRKLFALLIVFELEVYQEVTEQIGVLLPIPLEQKIHIYDYMMNLYTSSIMRVSLDQVIPMSLFADLDLTQMPFAIDTVLRTALKDNRYSDLGLQK